MLLVSEIAKMGEIDLNKHIDYLQIMIPILIEFAEEECNNTFDAEKPPAGVKLFISESLQYKLNSKGLASRGMGTVTYSYDTDLPEKIVMHLNKYKRLGW